MKRLIPVLTIKDRGLVKTVRFRKPCYIGDPINAVKIFNEKEVDELIVVDMYASRDNRQPDTVFLEEIVSEAFMPIAYGGGVSSLRQIENILRVGVEKISINFHAHSSLQLIEDAAREFGSSAVIGGIDVRTGFFGKTTVWKQNAKFNTGLNPIAYAKTLESAGAGELFVNSIDRDGTYSGYDIGLMKDIVRSVKIPVIGCGGASSLNDVQRLFQESGAAAAAAGSMFVFYGPQKAVLISYPDRLTFRRIVHAPTRKLSTDIC